jgi:hypothetical protein
VAAKLQMDSGASQLRFVGNRGLQIGQGHVRATAGKQMRGSHTAPSRSHYEHSLTVDGEIVLGHLSFNVVKLKSANRIAMIKNRVITLGSSQPLSSKW